MKYPLLSYPTENKLVLNDFSGGINKSVPAKFINANEQSDLKNMWFYEGELKPRPCINLKSEFSGYKKSNVILNKKQFFYKLELGALGADIYSFFIDENGTETQNETLHLEPKESDYAFTFVTAYHCFAFLYNETVYLAVAFRDKENFFAHGEFYELKNNAFLKVEEEKIYAPLIMINGKGNKYGTLPAPDNTVFAKASSFEGINLLTNRVRVQYTTDGVSSMFALTKSYMMDKEVTVRFCGSIKSSSAQSTEITISPGQRVNFPIGTNIKCYIREKYGSLVFEDKDGKEVAPDVSSIAGNLEIEFYLEENPNKQSIFEMEENCCFGGSGGSGKGNRLFLYKNKNNANLIRWSDINNPFYFPENNYANISNDKILTVKKQNDMLLIFSEKSIHYATYIGGEYSANDLLSGSVTDVTAVSAIFPITQLSGDMGIFSPNAATVINGKTYFLSNTKKVCRIDSSNSVTVLSEKIQPLINNTSADESVLLPFKNYLLTILGKNIFCFNINYFSWYYWEAPVIIYNAVKNSENPYLMAQNGIYGFFGKENFESYFKTAEFDFNAPEKLKKISGIYCSSNNGSIEFEFNGTKSKIKKPINNYKIIANAKNVYTLALKLWVKKSISGITVRYILSRK